MTVIVDYGVGNLGSIRNMLKVIGADAAVSSDPGVIGRARKLILPGVGAFDRGMEQLTRSSFFEVLCHKVREEQAPVLGICLGMQLMARGSEEGSIPGLGWLDARVVRFKPGAGSGKLRVPHMGWNTVAARRYDKLFRGLEESRFYFVHSYHLECARENDVLGVTAYGYEFISAVEHGNILGVQFHPEKSHRFGIQLLRNFVEIVR